MGAEETFKDGNDGRTESDGCGSGGHGELLKSNQHLVPAVACRADVKFGMLVTETRQIATTATV